jgi:hypothetical protein
VAYEFLWLNILSISHKSLGVIGWACFGQCGLVLDKPFKTNFKWKESNWGYSLSKNKCNNLTPLI